MKAKECFWPNQPPQGCPFPQSPSYRGILLTGRYANYENADTFYPSWFSDGNLYCPWTDGFLGSDECHSYLRDGVTQTGQVKIVGDEPFRLQQLQPGGSGNSAAQRPVSGHMFRTKHKPASDSEGWFVFTPGRV